MVPHVPRQAFTRGLIGKAAIVVLLNAVDNELTLLKLGRHTARELMPFRQIARASTPSNSSLAVRLAKALETLSEHLPGALGRRVEGWAHKLSFHAFQDHYDVAIGYLIAHEELVEEEMKSPSSFALNAIINQRAFEMVQENVKQANKHINKLKREGNWRTMCIVLDTVRAAHTLLNAFDHSVSELGGKGNLAEGECDRLLDLITLRGEWLHHAGVHYSVHESLPATMVRQLTRVSQEDRAATRGRRTTLGTRMRQSPPQLNAKDKAASMSSYPRRRAIRLTPQSRTLDIDDDDDDDSGGKDERAAAPAPWASPFAHRPAAAMLKRNKYKSTPAGLGRDINSPIDISSPGLAAGLSPQAQDRSGKSAVKFAADAHPSKITPPASPPSYERPAKTDSARRQPPVLVPDESAAPAQYHQQALVSHVTLAAPLSAQDETRLHA